MSNPRAVAPAAELYAAYLKGWEACMAGVDGRYWFTQPEECAFNPDLRRCWQIGWGDAMEAEDGEEPLPPGWLSLEDMCGASA